MNKTKIEWTEYTWNPVTGCKHNCPYCYAKKISMRFNEDFEPTPHPDRLRQPYELKKPSKIFVCSMADLFGDWVPDFWIKPIIKVAKENPQHTFQFLTKNPKRYLDFDFPENCSLGTTIDYPHQARLNYLKQAKANHKFISFEPLLGDMSALDLSGIDVCIIGADSTKGATPPKKEWIDSIEHHNKFFKNNIKKHL